MREEKINSIQRAFRTRFYFGLSLSVFAFLFMVFSFLTPLYDLALSIISVIIIVTGIILMGVTYKRGFKVEVQGKMNKIEQMRALNFDDKIRRIEKLKQDGLISDTEYATKRREVMNEKW